MNGLNVVIKIEQFALVEKFNYIFKFNIIALTFYLIKNVSQHLLFIQSEIVIIFIVSTLKFFLDKYFIVNI